MTTIRILLVEDYLVVAEGLQALIEDEPDLSVVGRATTVSEAMRRAGELHPDVALIDYRLPDGTGADVAAAMRRKHPGTAVLFLSRDESDLARMAAFEAGAAGYLFKSQAAADVVDALRRVARGEILTSSGEVADLLALRRQATHLVDRLTRREVQVLSFMAAGADNRRIAKELGIQYATVRSHVRNIVAKMEVHTRLEAVSRGIQLGLVETMTAVMSRAR
jgi:two-component system response regulator DevR